MTERQTILRRIEELLRQVQSHEASAERLQREGKSPGYWKREREFAARDLARVKELEASLAEFDRQEFESWFRRSSPSA